MIDKEFYTALEFQITTALRNSPNPEWRSYWCDGILLPNEDISHSIETSGSIITIAIIPKGQYENFETSETHYTDSYRPEILEPLSNH